MKNDQANAMLSLRTVDAFLDAHADKLPGIAQSGARRRLTGTLEAARDHTADQARSNIEAQGLTRKHRTLRTTLVRDHMRPIARVARADLSAIPDFQALRLPPSGVTPSKLFAAALGMAQVAQSNAQPFLDAGMAADFTAQLVSAAEAMMHALDSRKRRCTANATERRWAFGRPSPMGGTRFASSTRSSPGSCRAIPLCSRIGKRSRECVRAGPRGHRRRRPLTPLQPCRPEERR